VVGWPRAQLGTRMHCSSGPAPITFFFFIPTDFQIFKYIPNHFKLEFTKPNVTVFQKFTLLASGR
jgi:hypothetical protein